MRVLNVLHTSEFGGCEKLAANFMSIYSSDLLVLHNNQLENSALFESAEFTYQFTKLSLRRPLQLLFNIVNVRRKMPKYDCVIFWNGRDRFIESLFLLAQIASGNFIIHVGTANQQATKTEKYIWPLVKYKFSNRIRIIFPSRSVSESILQIRLFTKLRSFIVPNGVMRQNVSRDDRKETRLVTIGRLDQGKFVHLALEALALVERPLELLVIGNGAGLSELRTLATNLNISDRVSFIPGCSDPFSLLNKNDIFFFAVDAREGYGLALHEAISAGLPIIASRIPVVADVLAHEKLLFKNDTNSFLESLKFAIENIEEVRIYIEKIRDQPNGLHTMENMKNQYLEIAKS
jgi:glycosyltransferase involved in cell wall biosynthesis